MNTTVIITNYCTPALLAFSFGSVNLYYPDIAIILVDNGDSLQCANYIRTIVKTRPHTVGILNSSNVGHGIGMHQGLQHCSTQYAFTFDTDCKMIQPGLLELMLQYFDSNTYAVGSYGLITERGMAGVSGCSIPYIHPSALMLDRNKYFTLSPFVLHGAPCGFNMRDAANAGYKLIDIPIGVLKEYYTHKTKGTVDKTGIPLWNPTHEGRIENARVPEQVLKGIHTEVIR